MCKQDGKLRQQTVAVDVHDVGAVEHPLEYTVEPPPASDGVDPERAIEGTAAPARDPRYRPGEPGYSTSPRRVRDVLDRVPCLRRPLPELRGQERVGRLVGRQMRGDVKDVQGSREWTVSRQSLVVRRRKRSTGREIR